MNPFFTKNLLAWNQDLNTRMMPWKGEKDPYKIWISEIILQQTRVEQGLRYYEKFIQTFSTVCSLAHAPEQDVFKLWEGLGYYSRCKNLLTSARFICDQLNGKFPDTYEEIRELKGVGAYTAAAIASFAYQLPYAVVDGNVMRVLSRYFSISEPVDTTEGKKKYTQLAGDLLDRERPDLYNQAIMDFGAVVCKPQQPACTRCPLQSGCLAYKQGRVHELPLKKKGVRKRSRWLYYFVIIYQGEVCIRKRTGRDIWENLYEFVLQEVDTPFFIEDESVLQQNLRALLGHTDFTIRTISHEYRQELTHQTVTGKFVEVELHAPSPHLSGYERVSRPALDQYPFPRFITRYLQNTVD
ncbi:MAG: A/G-specific adenine glycosylase [Williamsia sp.]|nr:A/G-specific adenine glycosylase [Williamsia sp.]